LLAIAAPFGANGILRSEIEVPHIDGTSPINPTDGGVPDFLEPDDRPLALISDDPLKTPGEDRAVRR
jgi:hypothetical protein